MILKSQKINERKKERKTAEQQQIENELLNVYERKIALKWVKSNLTFESRLINLALL